MLCSLLLSSPCVWYIGIYMVTALSTPTPPPMEAMDPGVLEEDASIDWLAGTDLHGFDAVSYTHLTLPTILLV